MPSNLSLKELLDRSLLVGAESMTFVSGCVDATEEGVEQLLSWLRSLPAGRGGATPWWCCAEWTDRMRLSEVATPEAGELHRLVWGRWFGDAGDLEAWRDGERLRWRFVGDVEVRPPESLRPQDYFEDGVRLRQGEARTALLWKATDARIATAGRETMACLPPPPARLWVRYTPFYDHGVVAVVRYREILPGSDTEAGPTPTPEG